MCRRDHTPTRSGLSPSGSRPASGLPFDPVLEIARPSRPQAELVNSAQQVRNLQGAFTLARPPRLEPVLLVDGLVDSRWTLTVVGALLGRAGIIAVHPLVLAKGADR